MHQLNLFTRRPPNPAERLDALAVECERLTSQIGEEPTALQVRLAEALTAELEAVCDLVEGTT